MNKLLKQVLIVNGILLILGILFVSFTYYGQNYKKNHPLEIQYDSAGKPLPATIPAVPFQSVFSALFQIFFWVFPIFVILMSAVYLYKNPNIKNYFWSLVIPLSYGFLAIIFTVLISRIGNYGAEGSGFAFLFMLMQTGATFVLVLIINLIILGIKHYKKRK